MDKPFRTSVYLDKKTLRQFKNAVLTPNDLSLSEWLRKQMEAALERPNLSGKLPEDAATTANDRTYSKSG